MMMLTRAMMMTSALFVLILPVAMTLDKESLERIRLLHKDDGIDTATVHISYPHSPAFRRLTKREAAENLSPRQHDNFTVKVTLKSSGRVLNLQLQPSRLRVQGALVKVMHAGMVEEEYSVEDEGCHYHGFFDDSKGLASVHCCDGVLVGSAHNGDTEYSFHSHKHPLLDDTDDSATTTSTLISTLIFKERDRSDLDLVGGDESYHTIVSWRDASEAVAALNRPRGQERVAMDTAEAVAALNRPRGEERAAMDTAEAVAALNRPRGEERAAMDTAEAVAALNRPRGEERAAMDTAEAVAALNRPRGEERVAIDTARRERRRRQAEAGADGEEGEEGDEGQYDVGNEEQVVAPTEGGDDSPSTDVDTTKTPVVEFGIIFDEDFLRNTKYIYPTRRDLVQMLQVKYTGVQGLYGNPEVTGYNLIIQIKLIYLWYKNPSWYPGSTIPIGRRMGAGSNFSKENAQYRTTDSGALYTSQAPGGLAGMAFIGGACSWKYKTFVTRNYRLTWIVDAHEFGHTLGLQHVPWQCQRVTYPYGRGFMQGLKNVFMPCYSQELLRLLRLKKQECLFKENVNTMNIPLFTFQATFPVMAVGLNQYCRTSFKDSAVLAAQGPPESCGPVLCAVMDERNKESGMAQLYGGSDLSGRPCGPDGMICMGSSCRAQSNSTTIRVEDTVTGTGTWGKWSRYARHCTSACGVGVRISSRKCSNQERVEACQGHRYRAKLCETQPCPGDGLKGEAELRRDRANYTCSLLKARNGPLSQYMRPYSKPLSKKELTRSISLASCVVECALESRNQHLPRLQMKGFGMVIQADGVLCGPVNKFDRYVLGVTTRCLRGRCIEFGCDGVSMENRDGKVKDMCGTCGGDNSTCNNGQTTVDIAGTEKKTIAELPAGTTDILFALQSGNKKLKIALMDKEDSNVIVPGLRGLFRIVNNERNPLKFAGTHWTVRDNVILSAAGPLDQPMKIKVMNMNSSPSPIQAVVLWGYTLPQTVPPPPTCLNNGVANETNGGCMCVGNKRGKQCESSCRKLCFNGGLTVQRRCNCDCSSNPRTDPSARCQCLAGFEGPDCSQCAIQHCYHNGTLNAMSCRCQCPNECSDEPDCSACNYNPLLPGYRGHYGRGSVEEALLYPDDEEETGDDDVTSGQITIHTCPWLVSEMTARLVLFSIFPVLFEFPVF